MKLFAVLLGGRAKGCNIELHDVVFVAGNSLEETYPHLINLWFGMTKRLHIDASIELSNVDGYRIVLSQQETPAGQNKFLFFVNFGAYRANYFGEVHEMNFYVAESKSQALVKAKKELCVNLSERHCDDSLQLDIDDIILLDQLDRYYIHLIPEENAEAPKIESYYFRLDVPAFIEKANGLKTNIKESHFLSEIPNP